MTDRRRIGLLLPLARWPVWRWAVIGVLSTLWGALTVGVLALGVAPAGWAGQAVVLGAVLGAALGGGGALAIYLLLTQRVRLDDARLQIEALVNVRPITERLPLGLVGWAADPTLVDLILRTMMNRLPVQVLECGSGWSTVLVASCLRELGCGRIVALEHQNTFAERTRGLLARYGVTDRAEIVHAPLEERTIEGRTWQWYGSKVEDAIRDPVDFLIVDGPPGDLARESRYPAVPVLRDRLTPDVVIILDDGRRDDETRIAGAWGRELGVEPRYLDAGHGVWILERSERANVFGLDPHV